MLNHGQVGAARIEHGTKSEQQPKAIEWVAVWENEISHGVSVQVQLMN
jgi:hypothetical protein